MPINFLGWSEKVLEWQRHSEVGLAFNLNFVEWLIFKQRGKIEFLAGQEIQVIFQHLCYKYKHKVSTFHQEILFGNHCTCYLEYLCFCVSCILCIICENVNIEVNIHRFTLVEKSMHIYHIWAFCLRQTKLKLF